MGILTFIFFLLLGFYIFGLVVKVLFRMWIRRKARQFQQGQANGSFRTYTWGTGGRRDAQRPKPEGDVTVERTTPAQKRVSKSVGDYVDFEEVD